MRKIIVFTILAGFLLSCSGYRPSNQTWLPNTHKRTDFNKPPKRPR
ncbi:MAG: hypothetical protein MUE85_04750 [Microscillaceae bacterium]|jgi:hypothetical protein|nr:hypothetical protein [Microscillaceae bacterium]